MIKRNLTKFIAHCSRIWQKKCSKLINTGTYSRFAFIMKSEKLLL